MPRRDDDFAATGSPGRMAVLHLLSRRPDGAPDTDLHIAMRLADPRIDTDGRCRHVLKVLHQADLVARHRAADGSSTWFSPAARRAAQIRRDWAGNRLACGTHTTEDIDA